MECRPPRERFILFAWAVNAARRRRTFGGVSGYEELLEALADPGHEEHEAMKEWLGRPFDPTAFSVADANLRLRKRPRLSNKR